MTISQLFAKESPDVSFLGRFCFKKFKPISGELASDQPWPLYAEDWRIVEQERHPQSEFLPKFPEDCCFGLATAQAGVVIGAGVEDAGVGHISSVLEVRERESMESVVPGVYEENDSSDEHMVVAFVVIPGFQLCNSVVTCQVYLRNKNTSTLTEPWRQARSPRDKSLEKSSSDKIPASYLPGVSIGAVTRCQATRDLQICKHLRAQGALRVRNNPCLFRKAA